MAWNADRLYKGPHWECWEIESTAAPDIEYVINHGLGLVPLFIGLTSLNSAAAMGGYWIDDVTNLIAHLHKPVGGAGSKVHVSLSTLRHPH